MSAQIATGETAQTEANTEAPATVTEKATPPATGCEHSFEDSSAFECNICLELAKEPVVTLCGHLYCWPCLYRWVQVQHQYRNCPVCKAGVAVDKVIPIYGRGCDTDPRQEAVKVQPVPPRPAGQRPVSTRTGTPAAAQQGVLPALFGFQLAPGQGYAVEALTPEQQHQAFLSRLLLMLGSFVIMCLLLF